MSIKQPRKHAELIYAWADGNDIQFLDEDNTWEDCFEPLWDDGVIYRIKPEIKEFRVALMIVGTMSIDSEFDSKRIESNSNFVRWITDWIEYEQ